MRHRPIRSMQFTFKNTLRKGSIYIIFVVVVFLLIGALTSIAPSYRFSSSFLQNWTKHIDGVSFIHLFEMESKVYKHALPVDYPNIDIWETAFEATTAIRPNDARSFFGREIPGFKSYDRQILIAGEGTDYTNLSAESSPSLDIVVEKREATVPEEEIEEVKPNENQKTTGNRKVVLLYNTHNRESFLPYLKDSNDPNEAFHPEVNITKVSDQLAKSLEAQGVGTQVDKTDFGQILVDKNWNYSTHSYPASKEVVEAVLQSNKEIQYIFDLHRDSMRKDITTKEINNESYAKLMFVIGGNNPNFEKNYQLASELHNRLEEKYPGLSRGVEKYSGEGRNGVYNQDLSDNALTIEFGGVDNTMEELNRTSQALAEVFSDYYWNAEKVSNEGGQ
ncbi:stage II sporulation protein P [Saliterribacillus persicus]|uniref:Stage II sporulation protein P n=1 Tax=Saliterribacillus persicus TaxID=930114 RepID=A0A368XH25_9BACI|nr:stage II sporulation protein P [Saliterribacillus persicus]RCW65314.1 stage II sporulation protein P [Saliterribacillus persicus]